MVMALGRYGTTFRDPRGKSAKVGGYYTYDLDTAAHVGAAADATRAICAAIQNLSNAALVAQTGLAYDILNPFQFGASVDFPNAEDKVRLIFGTAGISKMVMLIPAPVDAIFEADAETVDVGNGLITALVGSLTAVDTGGGSAVTRGGLVIAEIIAGMRVRVRGQRKLNIFWKTPDLGGPDE